MTNPAAALTDLVEAKVLLSVLASVRHGNFSSRMPLGRTGDAGKVAELLNEVIAANEALVVESARMGQESDVPRRLATGGSTQRRPGGLEAVSRLISKVSHELRTPLSNLLLFAQHLEENPDNNMTAAQLEYASLIRASGNELSALLTSMLDLVKVEAGAVMFDYSRVSISDLGDDLLREFEEVARDKGITFSVGVLPHCPQFIVTDSQRLYQVLKNLLINAIKFTYRGGVVLSLGLAGDGWNRDSQSLNNARSVVALAVTDTGIGIDLQEHDRIFEPFARGDGSTAGVYGGAGLGLSISRELVDLLGGDLTVASTPGRGSTFTIYLPAVPTSTVAVGGVPVARIPSQDGVFGQAPRSDRAAHQPVIQVGRPRAGPLGSNTLAGARVLVVDDDYRNVFAMTALLERGGATVDVAESGADAIALLGQLPDIDIVLMDIMMPVMDGYETIRLIRARGDAYGTVPIIAVTSKVVAGERERCLDAGANDYVPKPVNAAQLLTALQPWVPVPAQSSSLSPPVVATLIAP